MAVSSQAFPQFRHGVADGTPPRVGVLLVGWRGGGQVGKRGVSFRENLPFRGCGQGANPAGSDIDTEHKGKV